jgi:hypothetical protein
MSKNIPPISHEAVDSLVALRGYVASAIDAKIAQLKSSTEKSQTLHTSKKDTTQSNRESSAHTAVTLEKEGENNPIVSQKEQHTVTPIQEMLADYVLTRSAIEHAVVQPELVGGALFWFAHMEASAPKEKKAQLRHEEGLIRITAHVEKLTEALQKTFKRNITSLFMVFAKALGLVKEPTDKSKDPIPMADGMRDGQEPLPAVSLLVALKELPTQSLLSFMAEVSKYIQPQQDHTAVDQKGKGTLLKTLTPEQAMGGGMFGLMYWLLLTDRAHAISISESESSNPQVHKETTSVTERSPWVLAAIIWYLSMVREAGQSQQAVSPVPATTQTPPHTTSSSIPSFPLSGVIFQAAFVIE